MKWWQILVAAWLLMGVLHLSILRHELSKGVAVLLFLVTATVLVVKWERWNRHPP